MMPRVASASVHKHIVGQSIHLRNSISLGSYPDSICDYLDIWALKAPNRPFLVERNHAGVWQESSYQDCRERVLHIAGYLNEVLPAPQACVVSLARNSTDLGLLTLASMRMGAVIAPINQKYLASDYGLKRLAQASKLLNAKLVFVDVLSKKLASQLSEIFPDAIFIAREVQSALGTRLSEVYSQFPTEVCQPKPQRDHVAKLLFTSGSTGAPKAVINTHGMLSAQQAQMAALWTFLEDAPPVLVDWLPWSHTSGGNNSFNMTLRNGGTLYIDQGAPTPAGIAESLKNLKSVSPTWYTNVPIGHTYLSRALADDSELAKAFFKRLDLLVYGGAGITDQVWGDIRRLGLQTTGQAPNWATGWGLTETTSTAAISYFPLSKAGIVGMPLPGMEIVLDPVGTNYEILVKGPNVSPGYISEEGPIQPLPGEDGYFRTGDLMRLEMPDVLVYEGRLAETFKLLNGQWISPNTIRTALLALIGDLVTDLVVVSPDQVSLTLGFWINDARGEALGLDETGICEVIRAAVKNYNASDIPPSTRVDAWFLLDGGYNVATGFITEKGNLNQVKMRSHLVNELTRGFLQVEPA